MDFGLLDQVLAMFVAAFKTGTLSLGAYSIPLLGAFALIGWYWNFGRSLALGGGMTGDALASALLYAINIGVAYWLCVNILPMGEALYNTFLMWGQSVGGSAASSAGATTALLTPSSLAGIGLTITAPLDAFIRAHAGPSALWNVHLLMGYGVANVAIILVFIVVAVALLFSVIEFYFSLMLGSILIPFGVFGPTAFLCEFAIGWIVGGAVRVLAIGAITGLGFPLFATLNLPTGPGGTPTFEGAIVMFTVGLVYVGLAVIIPQRAAGMCGRASMGITASGVLGAAMGWSRFATGAAATANAIRGASQMMQRRTT